ncbi:SDR family NAD(P)-dependent oxidoreductase [Paenibacillus physcomitrellae]|uniref:Oxidoreductase n=1 Tax=Paenibacillus physcomitrellae TaxID=1619311 RepID=A0ABQ1FRW9_9BACL|nr:SDR family NAD(P)-dependent oxidoreductase [Paenibacillus physcomitrellae]GGA25621.1 oxidoreductase [Paenibacillus physcomitrellae]
MLTNQKPIGSGFGAASTTSDVMSGIDLTGKTAIVTGGYSGLGLETVRAFQAGGANVIVPTRNKESAARALNALDNIEIEYMDLLDPASIDAFADKFMSSGRALHILVNSAGIMAVPELTLDDRGFEAHFATNHLGHFQLTSGLLPALRQANGARVVSVSARAHQLSRVVFDDIHFKQREYRPMLGYAQSKTANILFAAGLDAREKHNGIRAFSLHPGSIITNLGRNFTREQMQSFGVLDEQGHPVIDPEKQYKTVEQGAATQVWCATNPELVDLGGVYCENVEVAPLISLDGDNDTEDIQSTRLPGVMPYAVDPEEADRLWELSQRLVFGR